MIPALILAAGASSRMGRPKALLPTDRPGETFVGRLVDTLRRAGLDDVVIVVRPGLSFEDELRGAALPPREVVNPAPEGGQLSSLLTGLAVVDRPGVHAVLVTTVDQPLVSADTVLALIDAYRRTSAPVVRPVQGTRHGHPVIFDRALFDELRRADPSRGARSVVAAHRLDALDVEVEDEGAFIDVDTPEDYERVFGRRL